MPSHSFLSFSSHTSHLLCTCSSLYRHAHSHRRSKPAEERNDDYVELDEFRLLLIYLRQYFELYVAFSRLDSSFDGKVTLNEFRKGLDMMAAWGVHVPHDSVETEFESIDVNGGGHILFGARSTPLPMPSPCLCSPSPSLSSPSPCLPFPALCHTHARARTPHTPPLLAAAIHLTASHVRLMQTSSATGPSARISTSMTTTTLMMRMQAPTSRSDQRRRGRGTRAAASAAAARSRSSRCRSYRSGGVRWPRRVHRPTRWRTALCKRHARGRC